MPLQLGVDQRVMSPGMVEDLIRQVAGDIQAYPVRQAVSTRRARLLAIGAFVAFARSASGLAWPSTASRTPSSAFIFPGSNIMALGKVAIESVQPGNVRIERGSDLVVDVQTRGGPSSEVDAVLTYTYEGGDKPIAKALTRSRPISTGASSTGSRPRCGTP